MLLDCLIPIAMKEKAGLSLLVKLEFKAPAFLKKNTLVTFCGKVRGNLVLREGSSGSVHSGRDHLSLTAPHNYEKKEFFLFVFSFLPDPAVLV